jgi:hypothetical protein
VGEIPKRKGKMRYMGEDADKRKGNKRKQWEKVIRESRDIVIRDSINMWKDWHER